MSWRRWRPEAGDQGWSGWLPHLDLAVARAFTAGSADHDRLWDAIKRPGRLTLRTKLDLWQMLRPAVQPGSTTGYTLPDEEVTLELSGVRPDRGNHAGRKLAARRRCGRPISRPDRGEAEGAAAATARVFGGDRGPTDPRD